MNIFDNIRKGKFTPEFQQINLGSEEVLKEIIYTTKVKEINVSDETVEDTLRKLRQNPDIKPTVEDKANVLAFTKNLTENIEKTKRKIKDTKDKFTREIKKASDKHTFTFANKPDLVKYATNVFQERKDSLTADDFLVLIEMKKQIEMDQLIKYKEENI
jgi:hypothetical protein